LQLEKGDTHMTTSAATSIRAPSRKQLIIDAGRAHLKTWLLAAEAHGTIYYNVQSVSRSGMNRKIALSTIIEATPKRQTAQPGKPELVRLWPSIPDDKFNNLMRGASGYPQALDEVARDWGFSWDARAFNVNGAGMDLVFWLIDNLASKAGIGKLDPQGDGRSSYANRVRRESF
jgi:hypothetical protein